MKKIYFGIFRSREYLQWILSNPCDLCQAPSEHAHHEPLGENYTGGKPPDSHAIPLCAKCHSQRHMEGVDWLHRQIYVEKRIIQYLTRYLQEKEGK